jgi:hypothetical protein
MEKGSNSKDESEAEEPDCDPSKVTNLEKFPKRVFLIFHFYLTQISLIQHLQGKGQNVNEEEDGKEQNAIARTSTK